MNYPAKLILQFLLLISLVPIGPLSAFSEPEEKKGIVESFRDTFFNDGKNVAASASADNKQPVAADGSYRIFASFDNVGQLSTKSLVKIAGVAIGSVETIELDKNASTARVTMLIHKGQTLYTDDVASVRSVIGSSETYISILRGAMQSSIKPGAQLPETEPAVNLGDLAGKIFGICKGMEDSECAKCIVECYQSRRR